MRRGFSLIEVVIALVILSVGGAAALSLVVTADRRIQQAWVLEVALTRATEVADSLEADGEAASAGHSIEPWGRIDWAPGSGATVVTARIGADSTRPPAIRLAAARGP